MKTHLNSLPVTLYLSSFDCQEYQISLVHNHVLDIQLDCQAMTLFFLGEYHWSYLERRKRIQKREDISKKFRDLYDEAIKFRLRPNYEDYNSKDLVS